MIPVESKMNQEMRWGNTRNIAQKGEDDVYPEVSVEPDLQKDAEGRQKHSEDKLEDV